jgi:antitoxin component of MazEF toxin-antitoxin module
VTIPKAIADAHGIAPGAELEFESAGDVIRVRPKRRRRPVAAESTRAKLATFDEATRRQAERDANLRREQPALFETTDRGWRREDLYGDRGVPR